MATSFSLVSFSITILFIYAFFIISYGSSDQGQDETLSFSLYKDECPQLESLVREHLKEALKKDIGLAAGIMRLHFHDCFVQGCDGSVLLEKADRKEDNERDAKANESLRPTALKAINDIRAIIDSACRPSLVSCADILALAARDSVALSGGPTYEIPLGRRDSFRSATKSTAEANIPSPRLTVSALQTFFDRQNLTIRDLVSLSGAHTIGNAHCKTFTNRLYPNQDPTMNTTFANLLKTTCPAVNTINTTSNDLITPNTFDNSYYVDLTRRQGLFTSDQDLFTNARTKSMVADFANDQTLFFQNFAASMIKLGMLGVLTSPDGEIRTNCSAPNNPASFQNLFVSPALEEESVDLVSF